MKDFRLKLQEKNIKVAIVGFGYIGICIGAVIAKKGFEVFGIDTNKDIVDKINSQECPIEEPGLEELIKEHSNRISATTDFSIIQECDVIIVTVGTPLGKDYKPDKSQIEGAMSSICKFLNEDQLIILKSTVPPKTTENLVYERIKTINKFEDPLVCFCPERLAEGNAISEFENIPVVIGGMNERSSILASIFWEEVLGVETILLTSCTAAEMVKLADNLWIDLNIALANEVALLSDKLDIDSLEVISAANTLPKGNHNVNILFPGIGVGGYCLTKDPWFVHHLGKTFNLDLKTPVASRTINDSMPDYSFELIKNGIEKLGVEIGQARVAILGISFKNNTGDCRFTPTKPIIEKLIQAGCQVIIHDPWVNDETTYELTGLYPSKSIDECIIDADCVAYFTAHKQFREYPIQSVVQRCNNPALIFDGRGMFDKEQIKQIKSLGLNFKGIGR